MIKMEKKGDWKKLTERYRTKAQELFDKSSYQKNLGDMRRMQEQGAELLETVADIYYKKSRLSEANKYYRSALDNVWKKESKERIRDKINSLRSGKSLERNLFAFASIISLIGALFFISFNATGNSIGNLSKNNLSLLEIGLFAFGLIAFIFFKSRKK